MAGFGLADAQQAGPGRVLLEGVVEAQADEVVFAGDDAQGALIILFAEEVGHEEGDAALFHNAVKKLQSGPYVGAASFGLQAQHFANDEQDVGASFFWGDVFFDAVGEENDACFVVILGGGEGEGGADFRKEVAPQALAGAEKGRAADVYEQHERQLAFFFKELDIGVAGAGRNVPVNIAHIVAVLVGAHFAERHTFAFEGAVVFSRKEVLAQLARLVLNFAYLFEELFGVHDMWFEPFSTARAIFFGRFGLGCRQR